MSLSNNEALEVEAIVKRMLGRLQAPVAAQQDGSLVSDGHRVFNFQGAGVVVSDDSANRRTNINIPGRPSSSTTSVVLASSTSAHIKSLGALGSYASPPASWQTLGFSEDASWTAALVASDLGGDNANVIGGGSSPIWKTNLPTINQEKVLIRHVFTLPAGTISTAQLQVLVDAYVDGVYLNGTFIGSDTTLNLGTSIGSGVSASISPSLLTPGGSNILAVIARDNGNGTTGGNEGFAGYKLTTTNVTASTAFAQRKIRGTGNKTTTSTSFVVIDNTNLAAISLNLAAGGIARCTLIGQFAGSTTAVGALLDTQVLQPTLGTVRANSAAGIGTAFWSVALARWGICAVQTFTAAEAGVHTFQPMWATTAATLTLYNGTSGNDDSIVLFIAEVVA